MTMTTQERGVVGPASDSISNGQEDHCVDGGTATAQAGSQVDSAAEHLDNGQAGGGSGSDVNTGVEGEGVDLVMMSGEVFHRGRSHQLHLTQSRLRLLRSPQSAKARRASDSAVLEVTWRRVLCACEVPVKKSKSCSHPQQHQHQQLRRSNSEGSFPPADTPSRQGSNVFTLHYSVRNPKSNKVQCKNITLESRAGYAAQWIAHIEQQCKKGKPRKLLFIINPIGGKGTARQTFEKHVQPLMALAGVEQIVKVTERAKHAIDIVKTFDTSTVDGVVAVGGDGMYMEILHGLIVRRQQEEGINVDDPGSQLSPPNVSVGIVPAGTGNGVSEWFNGIIDVDTAALNIIQGKTRRANVFSVHESGKLVHYAGLLLGNGYFSHMIQRTDELRWMKRARYPYALVSSLLKKKQLLEFDVEVLKNQPETETDSKREEAQAASSGWCKLGHQKLVATMAFSAGIQEEGSRLTLNPFSRSFDFFLIRKSSPLDNFRFIFTFFTRNRNGLEKEYVKWIANIQGARFKMVTAGEEEEGVGGDDKLLQQQQHQHQHQQHQQEVLELCKLLDVDGELMHLTEPQFEVRLHPQFLPVFCVPELHR